MRGDSGGSNRWFRIGAGVGWVLLLATVAVVLGIWNWLEPRSVETPGLPHEIYLWNRAWNEAVHQSIREASGEVSRVVVLASQIDFVENQPQLTTVPVKWSWLSEAGRAVGAAVRVGAYSGSFDPNEPTGKMLRNACRAAIESASAEGVPLTEIQIDFDSPQSQLAGYRRWIEHLEGEFDPTPVTLTALPSWMASPDFSSLVRAADGYVLQVHSLETPAHIEKATALFDPERALRWVRQAIEVGAPFRVALPTYGYRLHFDEGGSYLGLSAENFSESFRSAPQSRLLQTDPEAVKRFLAKASRIESPALEGWIWFRMPVEGDRLNWSWDLLRRVKAGRRIPPDRLECRIVSEEPELVDLILVNAGFTAVELDKVRVVVRWKGDVVLAGDALRGFELKEVDPNTVEFHATGGSASPALSPQESRPIGWLRFEREAEVEVDVVSEG